MIRGFLTYCAAFLTGAASWLALNVVNALNPFLNWEYPFLRLFIGMTFPGGAPGWMHFLSHAAQSWLPFLAAFFVAYLLTQRQARFSGALLMYCAFLTWSWCMMSLLRLGVGLDTVFVLGLVGTFLGGFALYLPLVSPDRSE